MGKAGGQDVLSQGSQLRFLSCQPRVTELQAQPGGTAAKHTAMAQESSPQASQANQLAVQGLMTGPASRHRRHADPSSRRQQRDALREQRRRWVELGELGDLPGELAWLSCAGPLTCVCRVHSRWQVRCEAWSGQALGLQLDLFRVLQSWQGASRGAVMCPLMSSLCVR